MCSKVASNQMSSYRANLETLQYLRAIFMNNKRKLRELLNTLILTREVQLLSSASKAQQASKAKPGKRVAKTKAKTRRRRKPELDYPKISCFSP